jgi:hypothetical protein
VKLNPIAQYPQPSPAPETRWEWYSFQIGLLGFFLFPSPFFLFVAAALLGTAKREWEQWRSRPINQALGILFVLQLVSVAYCDRPLDALLGMGNYGPFYLFFAVIPSLVRTPTQLQRIAFLLVLGSVPHIILGWGQMLWDWQTPDWWSGMFGWSILPGGSPWLRMSSGFFYANNYAFYLAIILCFSLGLWLVAWRNWRSTGQNSTLIRLVGLSSIILGNTSTLWMTQSRNGWMLAVLAGIAIALYARWWWLLWFTGGCGGAVLWAAFLPAQGGASLREIIPFALWGRLSGDMYPIPDALSRSSVWQFALDRIHDRPLWGWGIRSFERLYEPAMGVWVAHPHNIFLLWGVEWGMPLALFFVLWVGWVCGQAMRRIWGSGLTSDRTHSILFALGLAWGLCILYNCFDVSIFDFRSNFLGWLLLTLVAGLGRPPVAPVGPDDP